jgi:hypothetical protein
MREMRDQISMNLTDTACWKRRKHNEQRGFCQHFFNLRASLRILAVLGFQSLLSYRKFAAESNVTGLVVEVL